MLQISSREHSCTLQLIEILSDLIIRPSVLLSPTCPSTAQIIFHIENSMVSSHVYNHLYSLKSSSSSALRDPHKFLCQLLFCTPVKGEKSFLIGPCPILTVYMEMKSIEVSVETEREFTRRLERLRVLVQP